MRFIKRVNAPNLSLHLDTFHMNIEETSFYEPVIAAGSRLRHIHMTESDRGMLGEGNVRWTTGNRFQWKLSSGEFLQFRSRHGGSRISLASV